MVCRPSSTTGGRDTGGGAVGRHDPAGGCGGGLSGGRSRPSRSRSSIGAGPSGETGQRGQDLE
ncbi:MAG TPA: hypothetical protein VFY46_04900 [Acidimicrobiia bacterium]|nr:hypothetical protein [Acidimicrobiia bacterium]